MNNAEPKRSSGQNQQMSSWRALSDFVCEFLTQDTSAARIVFAGLPADSPPRCAFGKDDPDVFAIEQHLAEFEKAVTTR